MTPKLLALTLGWTLAALLTGVTFAAAPGQEEWERVLQAAKKEGKVAIIGPTGAERRDALTIAFEKKYGIGVDYHADSGGQGRYSVGLGLSDGLAEQRAKQGVPVEIVDIRQLKEGSDTSPASGGLSIFNRAPHPSAAKVYINWLLSKEGQTIYARATGYISNRLDVPTDHTFPWRVPQPGSIKTYTQEAIDKKDDLFPILTEVFGR